MKSFPRIILKELEKLSSAVPDTGRTGLVRVIKAPITGRRFGLGDMTQISIEDFAKLDLRWQGSFGREG